MKPLSRLESLIQEIVERPAWLLSARRLHPLELTAALLRALEARAVRLVDRVLAPDVYVLRLHPDDFAAFADTVPHLVRGLEEYLGRTIAERDLTCSSPPRVSITADALVRSGRVQVDAAYSPPGEQRLDPLGAVKRAAPGAAGVDHRPRPRRLKVTPGEHNAVLAVHGLDGRTARYYRLERFPTTIGRSSSADITLLDGKVSREHARIERTDGGYVLVDLDSLNGTYLNGEQIRSDATLKDGDELQIGRIKLRFDIDGDV